eukprot:scaffold4964_cov96-Skeletonema_marinoi.AAC.2
MTYQSIIFAKKNKLGFISTRKIPRRGVFGATPFSCYAAPPVTIIKRLSRSAAVAAFNRQFSIIFCSNNDALSCHDATDDQKCLKIKS